MPNYKKKKVKKFNFSAEKPVKKSHNRDAETIEMSSDGKKKRAAQRPNSFRVVKGQKAERRQRLKVTAAMAAVLVLVCMLADFLLPVGIIETAVNGVSLLGAGGYPIEMSGGSVISVESRNGYYYTLTDTSLFAFADNGKRVYDVLHGYSNPVLKTSESRALIFDQGAGRLSVYNLAKKVNSFEEKEESIITAAISKNGVYAIVTRSEDYASTVTVYSKRGKVLYVWNSAKDTVNSVAISPSGKKLAVSTIGVSGGGSSSKVMVFEFDSADSVASFDITGQSVYSLENLGRGFCVLTKQGCKYISWHKYGTNDTVSELELSMFRRSSGGAVLVFNRSSDKSDNLIMLVSNKGEKISEMQFKGLISDIGYVGNHIYCMCDTSVYSYNTEGELLQTGNCDYGARRLSVIGKNEVAAISDSAISSVKLNKEEN